MAIIFLSTIFFGFLIFSLILRRNRSLPFLNSAYKVVVITGCDGGGFGEAISRQLLQRGYVVFSGCLNAEIAKKNTYSDLLTKNADRFHVVQMDVTNQQQMDDSVKLVKDWLNRNKNYRLWGMVNNAGIGGMAPFEIMSMESFERMYGVNVFGVVRSVKAFLPLLRQGGRDGRIVVVSSISAKLLTQYLTAYASTKAAVAKIGDILRGELAQFGINVSLIFPDFFRTNLINPSVCMYGFRREHNSVRLNDRQTYDEYGAEKLADELRHIVNEAIPKLSRHDSSPVIDCVTHAISSPTPKHHYFPIQWVMRIVRFLTALFPAFMAKRKLSL